MTMVAALKLREWAGLRINKFIIAGDSRITRNTEISGKLNSTFDSAQKVITVSPNIILGFAGDYRLITVISGLCDYLKEEDISGNPRFKQFAGFLRTEIKDYLLSNFNSEWENSSVLLMIQEFNTKITRLHKLELPEGTFVELNDGVHVIGMDAKSRSSFHEKYEENITRNINNGRMNFFDSANVALPLVMALGEFESEEVGGSIHCFSMEQTGWRNIGLARGFDGGTNWVATALGEKDINTQINGKENSRLTTDYSIVDHKLRTSVKSKLE